MRAPPVLGLAALLAPLAADATPLVLAHQGRLVDAGGVPLEGAFQLHLSLYDQASGGSPVWTETDNANLEGGYFSTLLGDGTPLPLSAFAEGDLYLGVAVDDAPELSPRLLLASVPTALRAHTATHLDGPVPYAALPVGQAAETVAAGDDPRFDALSGELAVLGERATALETSASEASAALGALATRADQAEQAAESLGQSVGTVRTMLTETQAQVEAVEGQLGELADHVEATYLPAAEAEDRFAPLPSGGGFTGTFWVEVQEGAGDPLDPATVLFLDFEDGLKDLSAHDHQVRAFDSATIVGDAKHGDHAIRFGDGGRGRLEVPWHEAFRIGTGADFTLDWWVKYDAAESGSPCHRVFQWGANLSNGFHVFYCSSTDNVGIGVSGSTNVGTPVAPLRGTGWHHFAVVRSAGTAKVYVDGIERASGAWTRENSTGSTLYFSAYPGDPTNTSAYWMHGNLDDVRFTVGKALWTSAFTPPTGIGPATVRKQVTVRDGVVVSME